jgi:hypothetical protein
MSRIDRLKEYAKPKGPHSAGRDQKNIDYWADRASENSNQATRATDHDIKLPSTTSRQPMRSTKSAPRTDAEIDARMRGKDDLNHEGSDYMKSVRRIT